MSNDLGYVAPANAAYKDPVTVNMVQGIYDNVTAIAMFLADYKSNVKISYVDANNVSVDTGSIMINGKLRRNTTTATVTWSNTGGNGIAETSSTGYYIWAVASGASSTFELAINNTSASMTGNANSRLIGWFWNDTGNSIEGVWYYDENKRKKYESKIFQINKTNYFVFNHNLGQKRFTSTMLYSAASDMTGAFNASSWWNSTQGFIMGGISDTQFDIRVEDAAAIEVIATGGGEVNSQSGYVKIFLNEI
jgi:hypothetical protein